MSALRLTKKTSRANATQAAEPSTPTPPAESAQPNLVALSAAAWATILKIAEKESRRDDLPDGSAHKVDVYFAAKIDDAPVYRRQFSGNMNVGHASVRASSTLPSVGVVVATILSELSEKHREALLRRLPEIAAANGGELPDIQDAGISAAADNLLAKLRQQKPQQVRGSVSVKVAPAQPSLSVFG